MGYGGGMGMYGGMYGGSMGMHGRQPNLQGQSGSTAEQQQQFDFRRELQSTIGKLKWWRCIGGLNATLGLAFGVA